MSTQNPPGKRTGLYLTGDDLMRIASAGNPSPITLVREALDAREATAARPGRGRKKAAAKGGPEMTSGAGVLAAHFGRLSPEECAHPRSRRDVKNPHFCHACGGNVA